MATAARRRLSTRLPLPTVPSLPGDIAQGTEVEGRFVVREPIGRGGSAVVYAAEQRSMGRKVALKVLKSDLGQDEDARRRFLREIRAVSALTDPHTVSVFDVGMTSDGLLFIAMELLRGLSLAEVMRREGGRLAPDRAVRLADQILDSLAEAHAAGIVHGDLKPENIFVMQRSGREFVKVLDFGIATFLDEAASGADPEETVGTVHYMSPEQVMGQPLDTRTDLYSLAVLVFEMVSGVVPFDGPTPVEIAFKKTRHEPPTIRAVSPDVTPPVRLELFLNRALSRDRTERPADADEFRRLLTEAMEAPAVAPPVAPSPPAAAPPPVAAPPPGVTRPPVSERPQGAAQTPIPAPPPSDPVRQASTLPRGPRIPVPRETEAPRPEAAAAPHRPRRDTAPGIPVVPPPDASGARDAGTANARAPGPARPASKPSQARSRRTGARLRDVVEAPVSPAARASRATAPEAPPAAAEDPAREPAREPAARPPTSLPYDRRRAPRERRARAVSWLADDREHKGTMTDVSPGGMFVASILLPSVGTPLDFLFADPARPGQALKLAGMVIRHVAQPSAPGEVRGFGVRWTFAHGVRLPLTVSELFERAALVSLDGTPVG